MQTLLITICLLGLAVIGLSIRILIRKDHFGAHDVGADREMRRRGIHCSTSQDREARRANPHRIDVKRLIWLPMVVVVLSGCGVKTQLKRADKKYDMGEYYAAAEAYKKVYPKISAKTQRELKAQIAYRQGECYRHINNSKAASSYQNAVRYKYQLQDSTVFISQARALQYQGKYKEAEKAYMQYLEGHPEDFAAQAGVFSCRQIDEWKKEKSRYRINLSKEFNNKRSSNFSPMYIGANADAMMFTSNRSVQSNAKKKKTKLSPITGQQTFNLWTSRKNAAGKWEEISLPEGLYGEEEESDEQKSDSSSTKGTGQRELGVCCFSSDGRTMYFTFSCPVIGQDQGAKIYRSDRTGGAWGEAQEVKLWNDSSITAAHPALCPTGDTLYFVSDAPGGMGGKDIWYSTEESGGWSVPLNMGPKVNTSGDEMFPYVHADGKLYFASNGQPGYGGLDLFYMDRDSNVFNMGQPFNSNGDDFGITFAGNSQNGMFSSNRGQKKGIDRIYEFVLPEMEFIVEGIVKDNDGNPVSDAQLRLIGDDGTNSKLAVRRDGTYRIRLNRNARYAMLATARGHLNATTKLNTLNLKDSKTYTEDFVLAPVSRPVKMDNIFYEFGSAELTKDSETGLNDLVKMLTDNPNITIELAAHTDMKGDSVFNVRLSERRAESVARYLIQHGIEAERLSTVGYGKQKPVVADEALHKQYRWIPIEQELTPEFILSLKEEQQEICNTLNRRTEFRVVRTTYKLY